MAQHARFSPSKLDNLALCVRFSHIPMESAATEGLDMHSSYESGNTAGLSEEQARVVQMALDYTEQIKAQGDFQELRELRVELQDLTFGTADRVLLGTAEAHVLDFKGIRVVSDHRFQVRTYAAAVLETYPEILKVTTHIVAPRLGDSPETMAFGRELLDEVRSEIQALYAGIDDFTTPPTPHEDLCRICKWAYKCPALNSTIVTAARSAGLPVPQEFEPSALVSDRDRIVAQTLAVFFENWAEQIKKFNAAYMVANDLKTLGSAYKLVQRSTGTRIPKEATGVCYVMLRDAGVASDSELISACTLSIPQLAAALSQTRGGSVDDHRYEIKALLREYCTEGQTAFLQKAKRGITEVQLLEANT
jgi:hypothetical protein